MVVHRFDEVTLEFYGIRGRDHINQVFQPGYEIILDPDNGRQRPKGIGYQNCFFTDTGEPIPDCRFTAPRGAVTRVTLVVDSPGVALLHCHTHGTSMNADLIILPHPAPPS